MQVLQDKPSPSPEPLAADVDVLGGDPSVGDTFLYPGLGTRGLHPAFRAAASAARRVYQRMLEIDLGKLELSDYTQRYLQSKLKRPEYEFSLVARMLGDLVSSTTAQRDGLSLVDCGGGSGLNCLVARAMGIGRVTYVDIYDVSCRDARRLAAEIGLAADDYVAGELRDVVSLFRRDGLTCDLLVSHDCIEHIYDIQEFFSWVPQLPGSALEFWISSAANPLRGKTRRTLTKVANEAEYHDRPASWGAKRRDTLRSHLAIRREIIRQCADNLDEAIVEQLAVATRGLHKPDILDAVQEYLSSGAIPRPEHPTNTCDPYTGNWAERLMDPFKLADSLQVRGLQAQALAGYWADEPKRPVKRFLKTFTNALMSRIGPVALRLASYYVLRGRKLDPAASSS